MYCDHPLVVVLVRRVVSRMLTCAYTVGGTVHLIAILRHLKGRQHHLLECFQKQMDERLAYELASAESAH